MKMTLSVLALILIPVLTFAQGANLTIFSEDGDKFILFLNAVQQNAAPQSNLRVEGLSQPFYKAKIVFQDKAKPVVEKNIAVNDPNTNAPADVVYRLKNKDGSVKLRFYSSEPVQQDYAPAPDAYVVHYGQPDQGTSVTRTTTTTTTIDQNNGGVSISSGFGNGGATITANPGNGTTQTTTTTTSTSYSSSTSYNDNNNHHARPSDCRSPMDWPSFKSAKETIGNAGFEDTKYSTAQGIISSNCLSTDQVMQICRLFGFEETKLKFAKEAYRKTTDPGNYFKVANVLGFDASKTELNNYIASGGR